MLRPKIDKGSDKKLISAIYDPKYIMNFVALHKKRPVKRMIFLAKIHLLRTIGVVKILPIITNRAHKP